MIRCAGPIPSSNGGAYASAHRTLRLGCGSLEQPEHRVFQAVRAASGQCCSADSAPQKFAKTWDRNFDSENVHDPPEGCRGAGYRGLLRVIFELLNVGDGAPTSLNQQTVGRGVQAIQLSSDFVGGIVWKLDLIYRLETSNPLMASTSSPPSS